MTDDALAQARREVAGIVLEFLVIAARRRRCSVRDLIGTPVEAAIAEGALRVLAEADELAARELRAPSHPAPAGAWEDDRETPPYAYGAFDEDDRKTPVQRVDARTLDAQVRPTAPAPQPRTRTDPRFPVSHPPPIPPAARRPKR